MNQYALREHLKSGPMRSVYLWARTAKRKLRHETLVGHVPYAATSFSPEDLRAMIAEAPDHTRLYYSLGLVYLESERPEDALKALAAFRSAEALGFASRLRTALYQSKCLALLGRTQEARGHVIALSPDALTDEEKELHSQILSGTLNSVISPALPPAWQTAARLLACPEDGTEPSKPAADTVGLLVCNDPNADSAVLCPDARYLLAAPEVTGLTPEQAIKLNLQFDVAVGPKEFGPRIKDCCHRFLPI